MTPKQLENFQRLLNPRHIAFIGGRDAITAIGEARRRGFKGKMWAVNPKRRDLAGIPCFTSIDDLPEAPDAAYVAIPTNAAVDAIEMLAVRGTGGAVCYTAGFKEAGATGAAAEARLREIVGDLALIGPNCYGVINYVRGSALWSFAHGGDSPGYGAAIITQSGMLSSDITMAQRSLPMAYMISAGNQAVLGQEDFLEAFCEDPAVRAIGFHIEGLQDVPRFETAALKALQHGVPVVALKTGTSAVGGALTISHTGSLSGVNELYEALFSRTGIISVSNPSQFMETLKYLCIVGAPKGRRVVGFTCSGGGATMLADYAEIIDLDFPPIEETTAKRLANLLPDIATVSNPLDYTTPIWGQPGRTAPVFTAAMNGIGADAVVLVQDYPAEGLDESLIFYQNDADAFAEAARNADLPAAVCATIPENLDKKTRDRLVGMDVAPMQGVHETLNAIRDAANWSVARTRILANPSAPLITLTPPAGEPQTLSEAEGKAWVACAGVVGLAVPKGRVTTGTDAATAAAELGFPIALKMTGKKLAHKTEAGAVALDLNDAAAVEAAVATMRASVAAHDPAVPTDTFLVERMSPPPIAELIVGIRKDSQFGYALTLGGGGVLVELMNDAATILLPAAPEEISAALTNLKVNTLMRGYRGYPRVNLDGLAATLSTFCTVATAGYDVREIEINPLFIYSDHTVAVDVLMQMELT